MFGKYAHSDTTTDDSLARETPDFSLVIGGPLYQIWRRTRLAGYALQLLHRRAIVHVLLAWLPLLLLSAASVRRSSMRMKNCVDCPYGSSTERRAVMIDVRHYRVLLESQRVEPSWSTALNCTSLALLGIEIVDLGHEDNRARTATRERTL
jgi:hypothetical protein